MRAPLKLASLGAPHAQVTPSAARLGEGADAPLVRPIRRGVVQDWDALESIYHHIFYEQARRAVPRYCDAAGKG